MFPFIVTENNYLLINYYIEKVCCDYPSRGVKGPVQIVQAPELCQTVPSGCYSIKHSINILIIHMQSEGSFLWTYQQYSRLVKFQSLTITCNDRVLDIFPVALIRYS